MNILKYLKMIILKIKCRIKFGEDNSLISCPDCNRKTIYIGDKIHYCFYCDINEFKIFDDIVGWIGKDFNTDNILEDNKEIEGCILEKVFSEVKKNELRRKVKNTKEYKELKYLVRD